MKNLIIIIIAILSAAGNIPDFDEAGFADNTSFEALFENEDSMTEFKGQVRKKGGTILCQYENDGEVLGVYEKDGNFTFCCIADSKFQEVYTVKKGTSSYQDLSKYKSSFGNVKLNVGSSAKALTVYSEDIGLVYRMICTEDYTDMDSVVHYTREGCLSSSFYYHNGEIGVLEYDNVACGIIIEKNNKVSLVARIEQEGVFDDNAVTFKLKPVKFEECNFHVMPDGNPPEDGFVYETLTNEQLWRHGIE